MCDVLTAWTVAAFAADVPLRYLLGVDVIVHRVTAIAGWPRRTLHIVGGIIGRPPVCAGVGNVVFHPLLVTDVPLHRQRIVIVADLREIALFPLTAID